MYRTEKKLFSFSEYNQQDATFHNSLISVRRSTCFRMVLRPTSGAQNCTYSVRNLSDQYCFQLLTWPGEQQLAVLVWQIPDAECAVLSSWWWTEKPSETYTASYRNKLRNAPCCWLYSANILAMHGPMNAKLISCPMNMRVLEPTKLWLWQFNLCFSPVSCLLLDAVNVTVSMDDFGKFNIMYHLQVYGLRFFEAYCPLMIT